MSADFIRALSLQGQVLWALALREIHVVHGRDKLGYLWELIKSGCGVAVFWTLRTIMGFHPTNGMPVLLFLLLGFTPVFLFSDMQRKGISALKQRASLLTFPQITTLDLRFSVAIVSTSTQLVILATFIAVAALLRYEFSLADPFTFVFSLIGLFLFSFGFSLLLSTLNLYVPLIKEVLPMCLRIIFFASGIFFSPAQMALKVGDWLMWNPIANYIELLRGSFLLSTPSSAVKMDLTITLTLSALALGLLLERYTRKKAASL